MALPGQSYYNLMEARRYLRETTGHDIIEQLLIDWIGQKRVKASVQGRGLWLSRKGPYMCGILEDEHQYDGIVDVEIDESQAQSMKVDPYAVVGTETVSVRGRLWQTDFQSMGHGYPLNFNATCLLIRAAELERLAEDLKATADAKEEGLEFDPEADTPWHMRVQIEATKRAKALQDGGARPTKNSLAPGLSKWCAENGVFPPSGIPPDDQTIRKFALKGWEPPET